MVALSQICLYLSVFFLVNCTGIIVKTNYGEIQGEVNGVVNQFKKIPFAKPPINELRWESPQEPESWSGILDATEQDIPACLQGCAPHSCMSESEDCLYLNVWTPRDAEFGNTNYTTLIWLHGGSFVQVEIGQLLYDPSNIVANIGDVIIVSPQYRLGIMGFLYDNTYNTGVKGNYGLQDQLLAIKWVYQNIQHFGGDKNNIVLFGESAGANSIASHLLYNQQYIKAGIMQSPSFHVPFRDPTTWYDVPVQFTNLIGCNPSNFSTASTLLNCWKSVDGNAILQTQLTESDYYSNPQGKYAANWPFVVSWSPTKNTDLVPDNPIFEWQKGNITTPPFIIGTNKDEMFYFINDDHKPIFGYDILYYTLYVIFGKPVIAQQILNFYGITNSATYSGDSYLYDYGFIFDDIWQCGVRNVLFNAKKKTKTKNIFYYNFDFIDEPQFTKFWNSVGGPHQACFTKNCHVMDLLYLFTPPMLMDIMDADTIDLGYKMQVLWTNFAKTLNPYTNINKNNFLRFSNIALLESKSTFKEFEDNNNCDFWDQIGYAGKFNSLLYNGKAQKSDLLLLIFGLLVLTNVICIMVLLVYCCAIKRNKQQFKNIWQSDTDNLDTENEEIGNLLK